MLDREVLALVEQAVKGSRPAFEALCAAKAKDVLYICINLMGSVPDGEDAAQEVFLQMQKSIRRLQNPHAFTAWMNRIIAHVCARMAKRNRRARGPLPLDDFAEQTEELNIEFLPQEFAEESEKKRAVLNALQALSYKHRQVLLLFYFEDLPVRDIASVLECSPKAVESLLYRARAAMKKQVETQIAVPELGTVQPAGLLVLSQILREDAAQSAMAEKAERLVPAAGGLLGGIGAALSAMGGAKLTGTAVALVATLAVAGVAGSTILNSSSAPAAQGAGGMPSVPQQLVEPIGSLPADADEPYTDASFAEGPTAESAPQNSAPSVGGPGGGGGDSSPTESSSGPSFPPPVSSAPGAENDGAPSQPGGGGGAGLAETQEVEGSFVFVDASGKAQPAYSPHAEGFTLRVYSGNALVAKTQADETGAFGLKLPAGEYTLKAQPLHGYGLVEGIAEIHFTTGGEALPTLEFTDVNPPTAALRFLDGAKREMDGGNIDPAFARVDAFDETPTTVRWQVKQGGAVLQSGTGTLVPLEEETLAPDWQGTDYTLYCVLTDSAGNQTVVERDFVMFKNG